MLYTLATLPKRPKVSQGGVTYDPLPIFSHSRPEAMLNTSKTDARTQNTMLEQEGGLCADKQEQHLSESWLN